jgi:hypothetical protein
MSLDVVYYNGFWYAAYSPVCPSRLSVLLAPGAAAENLQRELRLLSLLFNKIHIPRSHLLTFQSASHWEIVQLCCTSRDFRFLADSGILSTSILPTLDSRSDGDRIVARAHRNGWSNSVSQPYLSLVSGLTYDTIASTEESRRNVDLFQQYVEILKQQSAPLGDRVEQIKKRSQVDETPFLHEAFVELLSRDATLSSADKLQVWKETNSLYMATGCHDLGVDRRISWRPELEDASSSCDNRGSLRRLYSPQFLQSMMYAEGGVALVEAFFNADPEAAFSFRVRSSEGSEVWSDFRRDFTQMIHTISLLSRVSDSWASMSDSRLIEEYKAHVLRGEGEFWDEAMLGLLSGAEDAVDPAFSKALGGGNKMASKWASRWLVKRALRRKIPGYCGFWEHLARCLG